MDREEFANFMEDFYREEVKPNLNYSNPGLFPALNEITGEVEKEDFNRAQAQIAFLISNFMEDACGYCGFEDHDQFFDEKLDSLRQSGQEEYSRKDQNAFANFERISSVLGISKEEVLCVYLAKHFDGIISWHEGNKDQREELSDRLGDSCVYLFLLAGMLEEKKEDGDDED